MGDCDCGVRIGASNEIQGDNFGILKLENLKVFEIEKPIFFVFLFFLFLFLLVFYQLYLKFSTLKKKDNLTWQIGMEL